MTVAAVAIAGGRRDRNGVRPCACAKEAAIAWLAVGGLAFTLLLLVGYQSLAPVYSSRQLVQRIRPALDAATRVYYVQMFDHSFLFYAGRTAIMVGDKDELDTSLSWEHDRNYLPTVEAFSRAWRRDGPAVALMPPYEYDS